MDQAEMLQAAQIKCPIEQIEEDALRLLQSGNETLLNLLDDFCQIKRSITVMYFYERKPTPVGKIFGRDDMHVSLD